MTIQEAIKLLELHGGHIYRDKGDDKVEIHRWDDESWEVFLKCRASLFVSDLLATDWKHSKRG